MDPNQVRQLRTIAIDLTPVLPGGENGGARLFVEALITRLAAQHPRVQFVLLTQAASHDELARLDRPNVVRRQVVGEGLRSGLMRLADWLLPRLPSQARRMLSRLGYAVNRMLKRTGSRGLLRAIGADLLFCPFTAPTYWEPGLPTVCTLYDLQYRVHPEFFSAEDAAHRDQVFRAACRRADLMIAISDHARDCAIATGCAEPNRLRTQHLQMARRLTESETEPAPPSGSTVDPGRYFLYPANFWPHKNHETLFSAFEMATSHGLPADIKLICTGAPGQRQAQARRIAAQCASADRILFPGYVSDAALSGLMRQAEALIFPSLYEGFGLPVIEAMALGVPVACSDRAALPEVVGGAALLFDPLDAEQIARAMVRLAADEAKRESLVTAGLTRAAQFADADGMASAYWQAFLDASR